MNKNIVIGVVVVILVVGGVYWFMQSGASNTPLYRAPNASQPTSTGAETSQSATRTIMIQNFSFNQASVTVKKGDVVVWTNKDAMSHTVTGNNGGPSSPTIPTNGTYSYTFNDAGTFMYHCAIHPAMTGNVIVE